MDLDNILQEIDDMHVAAIDRLSSMSKEERAGWQQYQDAKNERADREWEEFKAEYDKATEDALDEALAMFNPNDPFDAEMITMLTSAAGR